MMHYGFQSTYEELKQIFCSVHVDGLQLRFQTTYEELKPGSGRYRSRLGN